MIHKDGEKETNLVIKRRKYIILFVLLLSIILIPIIKSYPTKSDLIMTPSSHKDIEYLHVDGNNLGSNKVEFALYDVECSSYEICILAAKDKDKRIFRTKDSVKIYADGREITSYSHIKHSSFWKDNIIILINNLPKAEELVVNYMDDTISIKTE